MRISHRGWDFGKVFWLEGQESGIMLMLFILRLAACKGLEIDYKMLDWS